MLRSALGILALIAVLVLAPLPGRAQITSVPTADQAMTAAIAKARASLPRFFARLAEPQPGDEGFAVKIRYTTRRGDGEHIWATEVVRSGDTVTATINNQPRDIPDLRHGQRVTVPIAQLTDWMYRRNGKIHGGSTIRALLPHMSRDEAERLRAMLAPE